MSNSKNDILSAFLLGFALAMFIASAAIKSVREDLQNQAISLGFARHNPTNGVIEWVTNTVNNTNSK